MLYEKYSKCCTKGVLSVQVDIWVFIIDWTDWMTQPLNVVQMKRIEKNSQVIRTAPPMCANMKEVLTLLHTVARRVRWDNRQHGKSLFFSLPFSYLFWKQFIVFVVNNAITFCCDDVREEDCLSCINTVFCLKEILETPLSSSPWIYTRTVCSLGCCVYVCVYVCSYCFKCLTIVLVTGS